MLRALGSLLRVLVFAAGVGVLIMTWRFVVPGLAAALAVPAMRMPLEGSLAFALLLTPFALMGLALRPGLWKYCALPIVWALVATIILRPAALSSLF